MSTTRRTSILNRITFAILVALLALYAFGGRLMDFILHDRRFLPVAEIASTGVLTFATWNRSCADVAAGSSMEIPTDIASHVRWAKVIVRATIRDIGPRRFNSTDGTRDTAIREYETSRATKPHLRYRTVILDVAEELVGSPGIAGIVALRFDKTERNQRPNNVFCESEEGEEGIVVYSWDFRRNLEPSAVATAAVGNSPNPSWLMYLGDMARELGDEAGKPYAIAEPDRWYVIRGDTVTDSATRIEFPLSELMAAIEERQATGP